MKNIPNIDGIRRIAAVSLAVVGSGMLLPADTVGQFIPRRSRLRPCVSHTLPAADYQYQNHSSIVTAVSNRHVFIGEVAAAVQPRITTRDIARTQSQTISNSLELQNVPPNVDVDLHTIGTGEHKFKRLAPLKTMIVNRAEDGAGQGENASKGKRILPGTVVETTIVRDQDLASESKADPLLNLGRKLFQWSQREFAIDHCQISDVAFRIDRNGNWNINLRADQNRRADDPALQRYNPTLHIKRNRFAVRIRCLGGISSSVEATVKTGKPVFCEIEVPEFWVENGQPKFMDKGGFDRQLYENYEFIDHVELEFFYYK